MLDYAGPDRFEPSDRRRGVDEHPHRGFETVTISYTGSVDHRDSAGNSGSIQAQWMTAASGVVNEEKHGKNLTAKGGDFEMVQLWLNLPYKRSKPRYQTLLSSDIPRIELGPGAYARVIAGELNGGRGPAKTFTPLNVFDVRLQAGADGSLNLPPGHNAAIVLVRGDIVVNGNGMKGEPQFAPLSHDGEGVHLEAKERSIDRSSTKRRPINEPVVSYRPFVMNTEAEIRQAFEDYKPGRMGHVSQICIAPPFFRTRKDLNQIAKSPIRLNPDHPSTVFRVRINNLKPRTTYYYSVDSIEANGTIEGKRSPVKQFTTP